MPDFRYPKMVLMGELEKGMRNQGKPKQRWKDKIRTDMKVFGIDEKDWWVKSEDRAEWRHILWSEAIQSEKTRIEKLELKRKERKMKEETKNLQPNMLGVYVCTVADCGRTFKLLSSMKRHITQSHDQKQARTQGSLKCPRCAKTCSSRSGLSRHKCPSGPQAEAQRRATSHGEERS